MARSQEKSVRKVSGGRYHHFRTKKKYELAGFPALTKLGKERKTVASRVMSGNKKHVVLVVNKINVADKKGKTAAVDILNVVGNPANPQLVIRNIITKGAIVETALGKVRVTSRPGQEGSLSGVIV